MPWLDISINLDTTSVTNAPHSVYSFYSSAGYIDTQEGRYIPNYYGYWRTAFLSGTYFGIKFGTVTGSSNVKGYFYSPRDGGFNYFWYESKADIVCTAKSSCFEGKFQKGNNGKYVLVLAFENSVGLKITCGDRVVYGGVSED